MKKEVIDTARTIEIEKEGEYEDLVGHLHGDSEFTGPVSKRKCTNISFLIVFIVFNIGLIGIATYILIKGSPDRLGKGFDIRANTCGIGNLKEKRFMLFPNATSLHWSLCVEACPYYYYENYYCIYDEKDPNIYYPEWGCFDAYSTTAYGFYCIPADNGRKLVMDYLENIINVVQIATGDVYRIWEIVLIGYIFSMAIGLSYLYLMRITKIARKLVMCSVYALIFLSVLVVYLLYHTGIRSLSQSCGDYGPASTNYCDKSTYTFYITISITSGVLLLIYILKISKKYSSFEMGVSMIELTSKPLRVMKELAVFPIIQIFIGSCILLLLILLIGWNLSTFTKTQISKSDIPGGYGYILEYTALEKYMLAYNAIMSIWWCNFIVDLGKFVMSGGVSTWYFSRQKSVLYVKKYVGSFICIVQIRNEVSYRFYRHGVDFTNFQ